MYEGLKSLLLALVKVPSEPVDPMGDVRSLRVFRAAPGYWRYIVLGWLISQVGLLVGGLLVLVPLLIGSMAAGLDLVVTIGLELLAVLLFLIQASVSYFALRLSYEMRWYKVTDRSLRIRWGIWSVHEMTMTFANVQNITVTQGPLERLFGISDVRVDTAGGGAGATAHGQGEGLGANLHVGVFRGVDNPEEIRDLMLERLRRVRDTGLGDIDDLRSRERAPARSLGSGINAEMVNLLAAFRDEARALRRAAEAAAFPADGADPQPSKTPL
jgi:membrane protein YdbS with pleckstrin-like domain